MLQYLKKWFPQHHIKPAKTIGVVNYAPNIDYPKADWRPYLSLPYRTQWEQTWDEDNCATRSMIETLEAILNYYLKNNLLPQPIVQFLTNNQFINSLGWVKLSIRYNATVNNTTKNGVSVDTVWNNLATYGVVPEAWYPDPATPFTWNEYYAPVPENVLAMGKQFATILKVTWTTIANNNWNAPNIPLLQQNLQNCPLYFASNYGQIDANGIEQPNLNKQYSHARVLCAIDNYLEVLNSYEIAVIDPELSTDVNYLEQLNLACRLACVVICKLEII